MSPSRRRFLAQAVALPAAARASAGDAPAAGEGAGAVVGAGPRGVLYSRIGYAPRERTRVVLRAGTREGWADGARATLAGGARSPRVARAGYWGDCWGAHWWVVDFGPVPAGEYALAVAGDEAGAHAVRVAEDVLWASTYPWAAADMLERRKHFTKVGAGWQDAGALWAESPAQSAMLLCLADVVDDFGDDVGPAFAKRVYDQLVVGADYLVLCAEKAVELGHPLGAQSHDLLGNEEYVLPNDTMKAVVALYRAAAVLPEGDFPDRRTTYRRVAGEGLRYLREAARPLGAQGMSLVQRGLPEDTAIPDDEWPTRDLLFLAWACLEGWKAGVAGCEEACLAYVRRLMGRQVGADAPEAGYHGHFREYDSLPHTEMLWSHCIVSAQELSFGADIGAVFANYLAPVFELLERHPDHADAPAWRRCLRDYAEGFLLPATARNPFALAPLGIFGDEGPVWFAGPFHGTNAAYGYTAAFAARLHRHWPEPRLLEVARGNLQWVAGLNAGLTREAQAAGCVIFADDLPAGRAVPVSMVCRVGDRWAGTWFQTRGVVCNGFSVGPQFALGPPPAADVDAPSSFTDEDWIPHSAAFLTGLMQLKRALA